MDFKLVFVLGCLLFAGVAIADEYNNDYDYSQSDERGKFGKKEATSDEKMIIEEPNDETLKALATKEEDADARKKRIYYCGNKRFNSSTQLCCFGKVHKRRAYFACCGYFYYNKRTSKCCTYYTVKPRKGKCPGFWL